MGRSTDDVQYEQAIDALLAEFPDLRSAYEQTLDMWDDDLPGPHVVYGDIMNPYIDHLLLKKDLGSLARVFAFLERLTKSSDARVRGLVTVTVCEHLGADRKTLPYAQSLMLPNTLHLSREVEKFWNPE